MAQHLMIDLSTGSPYIVDKEGRRRPLADASLEELMTAAGDSRTPEEILVAALHDCPECRAAMAAGHEPVIIPPRRAGHARKGIRH
jgi:hypothetical protein